MNQQFLIQKYLDEESMSLNYGVIQQAEKKMFNLSATVPGKCHRLRLGRAAYYLNDFYNFTLKEIGEMLGISSEQVRRYQSFYLNNLRLQIHIYTVQEEME